VNTQLTAGTRRQRGLAILLLLCAASAQAQLFKSIGPDGKVTYSDTPPVSPAVKVERKSLAGGSASDATLPFELAEAVKNNPVTLYTTTTCAPCDDARAMLRARGVPFSEKTITTNEDQLKFKQVGGEGQLPLLVVGRSKQRGYESGAWNAALTAAAYPETSQLPPNYQFRAAEPAAPPAESKPVPTKKLTDPAEDPNTKQPPAPTDNTPPGFRF
jgi:glutaredoxin